jgi:RNA polymerase sigma factor (sigma-70 family)
LCSAKEAVFRRFFSFFLSPIAPQVMHAPNYALNIQALPTDFATRIEEKNGVDLSLAKRKGDKLKAMSGNNGKLDSDFQLWQAFKAGSEEAFDQLYQSTVKDLYNYAYNLCRDVTLVEDVIQDLFVYLYDHRNGLGSTDNIKFYLFRTVRRMLARQAKKNGLTESDGELFENALFYSEDLNLQWVEEESNFLQRRQVMSQVDKLPRRQREAVFLLYVNGFSYQETAATMNLEVKSVYNLINKAIQTLRQNLLNLVFLCLLLFLSQ